MDGETAKLVQAVSYSNTIHVYVKAVPELPIVFLLAAQFAKYCNSNHLQVPLTYPRPQTRTVNTNTVPR